MKTGNSSNKDDPLTLPFLAQPFPAASEIPLANLSANAHLSPTIPNRFPAKRSAAAYRSRDARAKPAPPSSTTAAATQARVPKNIRTYGILLAHGAMPPATSNQCLVAEDECPRRLLIRRRPACLPE